MTRVHHLQAAALAVVLLLGGELFCGFMIPGKYYALRGSTSIEEMMEKRANETLDTFIKTVNEQSLKKEELSPLVERLNDVENKLNKPPNEKDINDLQKKLSALEDKLKTQEGSSVSDKDLKTLEDKISAFETKMKDNKVNEKDMVLLKFKMREFEDKLKSHEGASVEKDDLKTVEGLISSLESNIQALNKTTVPVAAEDNDPPSAKDSSHLTAPETDAQPAKKKGAAVTDPVAYKQALLAKKTNKKPTQSGTEESVAPAAEKKNATITLAPPPHKVTPPTLSRDQVALLNTFSPKNAPIMGRRLANITNPVKVRVLLLSPRWLKKNKDQPSHLWYISDEMSNIVLDGLKKSPYFENLEPTVVPDHRMKKQVVLEEEEDVVWLVDAKNFAPRSYTNYSVDEEVLRAANATINYQKRLSKKPSLKVAFVDYREKTAGRSSNCGPERKTLIKLLGAGNVRQVVGRIAAARQWDSKKDWVDPGTVWNNQDYTCSGTRTIYSPYTVRSDVVKTVEEIFPKHLRMKDKGKIGITPVDTIRYQDVFYNSVEQQQYHSQLRNAVSEVVSSLKGTMVGTRKIVTSTEVTPQEGGPGGTAGVSQSHVENLLTSKIVVVGQRDMWEGDYNLFEAFAAGALVMTDRMLALPAGLIDGENVVVYHSRDDLRDMLLHYLSPEQESVRLEIARRGYEVAMGLHRSYHQVEQLFFGKPLSPSTLSQNLLLDSKDKAAASIVDPIDEKSTSSKQQSPLEKDQTASDTATDKQVKRSSILTKQEIALLETFNPEHAPILGDRKPDVENPARVRVLQMSPKKRKMRAREGEYVGNGMGLLGDEMINIVLDGLERSPYFESLQPTIVKDYKVHLEIVLQEDKDVIWVVDSRNLTLPSYHFSVDQNVLSAAKATVKYQQSLNIAKKPSLSVVFVDYHDKLAGRGAMCSPEREELIKLLGVGNVRHVVGKVVTGRSWNSETKWTEPGTIWENKDHQCFQKPTLRAPYTVRSDYAEAVEQIFPKFLNNSTVSRDEKSLTPVDTVRLMDVAHYWDQERAEGHENEYRSHSQLRNAVSAVVSSLNGTMAGKRKIRALASTVSDGGSTGRTGVSGSYLESLLTTKIVVVAQRDIWEDHYRLFEAFVGGAMVMTDLMISLPPGLVDGENVVMYRSLDDLKELLLHYLDPKQDEVRLEIARKGYEVAMGQHRSYHRMEEVFYGKRLSPPTLAPAGQSKHQQAGKAKSSSVATPTAKKRTKNVVSMNPSETLAAIKKKRAKKPEQR